MPNFRAPYAQTALQLFNQLLQERYEQEALLKVRGGLDVARTLFACRLDTTGRIFLSHVIGTAGVLVSEGERPALVVAGLLHNVYRNGRFPTGGRGASEAHRLYLRKSVGDEVEKMVFRFSSEPWNPDRLSELLLQDVLESGQKDILLLRFADAIDHASMLSLTHPSEAQNRKRFERDRTLMVALARKHGLEHIAAVWLKEMALYDGKELSSELAEQLSSLGQGIMPASYMGGVRQKIRRLRARIGLQTG